MPSSYSDFKLLSTSISPSGVATVTISNGDMNIITAELYAEWVGLVPMLANDPAVKVVVLKSDKNGFFMAHFDGTLNARAGMERWDC